MSFSFYLLIYLAAGVVVLVMIRQLFRSTGIGTYRYLNVTARWRELSIGNIIECLIWVLLWPYNLFMDLLWWAGDRLYVREQRRQSREGKTASPYSDLSTDELLEKQEKALADIQKNKEPSP